MEKEGKLKLQVLEEVMVRKMLFYKMLKKMGPPKIIEYDYSKLKDVFGIMK